MRTLIDASAFMRELSSQVVADDLYGMGVQEGLNRAMEIAIRATFVQPNKVYRVERAHADWCEDYACIVCAADAMWAEKIARQSSDDFRRSALQVYEVDLENEGVLLTANTGA